MSIKHVLFVVCVWAVMLPLTASLPCDPCTYPGLNETITGFTNPNLLAFSSQGCLAVGDGTASTVTLYRLDESCRVVSTSVPLTIAQGINAPVGLAFSPNGSCLIVANAGNGTVAVYQVGQDCQILNDGNPVGIPLMITGVTTLAVSSLGCVAVTTLTEIHSFSIDEDTCTLTPTPDSPQAFPGTIATAFSADGSCFTAINLEDSQIFLSSASVTNCSITFLVAAAISPIVALAYSPNNCLTLASSLENIVVLGQTSNCILSNLVVITNGIVAPTRLAYSSNNCLAVANAASVTIYSIASDCTVNNGGAPISTISVPTPLAISFSLDNTCLAVSSGSSVFLYSATLLTPIITAVTGGCTDTTITGITSANTDVIVFANGVFLASGTSDGAGNFSITTGPLPVGTSSITVQAQDPITMCLSAISDPFAVVLTAPVITQVFSTCLGAAVIGTATPGATVTILVNGAPVATGVANAEGRFIVPSIALANGTYLFTVIDTSTGCTSAPVRADIDIRPCILSVPNLAVCGSHCNV